MKFKRIGVDQARELISQAVQLVDIRDDQAYGQGHIGDAIHLHNSNLQEFLEQADPELPLLVYCYHGHMSQGAAAFFAEHGFSETYSLDGGFEAWKLTEPVAE